MSTSARKVALITGGTKGIGKATAIHLASLNFDVALNYASSTKDFEVTKEAVEALGLNTKVFGVQADLSKTEECTRVVQEVVNEFGKIDVLINNAGIAIYKDFFSATAEDLDKSHALNYRAPFLLSQAAVPHIPKGGRIIFISSSLTALNQVLPQHVVYVPTKGAIEQLARVLARTLGDPKYEIRVNTVSPGPTATELFFAGKSEQLVKTIASWSPFNRIGTPEEMAQAIGFFATSGDWVSGQNLRCNGAYVV